MTRKLVGLALFSFVLFGAILAGYWDMLNAEKLRVVRDQASDAVGEIAAIVRNDPKLEAPAPAEDGAEGPETSPSAPASGPAGIADARPDAEAPPVSVPASEEAAAFDTVPGQAARPTRGAVPPVGDPATPPGDPGPPTGDPVPPTFDILRVDPDGAMVLAGRAPAGADVALRDGGDLLGEERANASGEFVVVLEKPLGVGEHQIKIDATLADGTRVASEETAIVSIPESGREEELLAIVEAPEQASRLIAVPTAPPSADAAAASADPTVATASLPEAGTDLVLPEAKEGGSSDLVGDKAASPAADDAAVPVLLAVEAIEIEDDTVYVAGRAESAASVRVYIDNGFLAEAPVRSGDRFLITAAADVAPGEHTVRADALNAAGAVVARVEVPFSRPEGRAMAALAPSRQMAQPDASLAEKPAPSPEAAAPAPDLESQLAPSASASTSVPAAPSGTPSPERKAGGEPSAVNRQPGQPTPQVSPSVSLPQTSAGSPRVPGATPSDAPSAAGATRSPASAAAALADPGVARPDAAPLQPRAPSTQPDGSESADAASPSKASPTLDTVPTIRQPALETVTSRVIIRRGDTLWRISRDTYGRGARYTVIYLANGDQIRDPNRIYPGQVFRMPEDERAGSEAPRG